MTVLRVVDTIPALDPDTVLAEAKGEFESVVVIGFDRNGDLDVRASLNISQATILFMLEKFKFGLLSGEYVE
jgi:hypothetical protein